MPARTILLTTSLALLLASVLEAQTPTPPVITIVSPAGGQVGTTFDLKVTGQNMEQAEGLLFNFAGAKVEVLASEKAAPTAEMKQRQGKPPAAQLTQKFKITLPKDAPPGIQDVRVVAKGGVSNPRAFVIGSQPEAIEQEPNDDLPKAQRIALNSGMSGVVGAPTDVDYYAFTGKKGQRIICSCLASSIDSKLPAALQVYSAAGTYLGFNRGYNREDALVDVTLPEDGEYYVRVFSFSYTVGGPDYFYHLTVSQAPWIDAIFPAAVAPGKESRVTLYGRNLPGGTADATATIDGRVLDKATATIKAPAGAEAQQRLAFSGPIAPSASFLDGFEYRVRNQHGVSNPVMLTFARAPLVLDNEKNDAPESAQAISVPAEIAGRIEKKGERDWYTFTARKGDVYSIEAHGERLGAGMDLHLVLRDGKGNVITDLDDSPDILSTQFYTRSDDPQRFRFVAKDDGSYQLMVGTRDAFTVYGPRQQYLVSIVPETPDFRVVAMPPSLTTPEAAVLGQSGSFAFNLYPWRLGGFNGDITVTAGDLPKGLTIKPQTLTSGQKQGMLIVTAAPDAAPWAGPLRLSATAEVNGKKLVREVRSASLTWPSPQQQNVPAFSRIDRGLVLAVRGKAPYSLTAKTDRIDVAQGDKVTIPVKVAAVAGDFKTNVQVGALGLPQGVNLPPLTLAPGKDGNLVLETRTGFSPGTYALVLKGQTQPQQGMQQQPQKGAPPNLVEYAGPITLTIAAKAKAK
jgi:hypothetical protein